jgi:hypothetical protein
MEYGPAAIRGISSLFGGSEITEEERTAGNETYFVNDGDTLSEVVYGSGQYAGRQLK